jgi:cytochrome c553
MIGVVLMSAPPGLGLRRKLETLHIHRRIGPQAAGGVNMQARYPRPAGLVAAVSMLLGLGLGPEARAGDATAGLKKSAICASCHGPVGKSPIPTYPNIAGQNPLYIDYALQRYKAGERRGAQAGMMYTVTQSLTPADIADLAAYYASLPVR